MAGGGAGKGPRLGEEDFLKKMPLEMMEYPKPIIAAINGHAIGRADVRALLAHSRPFPSLTREPRYPRHGVAPQVPKIARTSPPRLVV